MRGLLTALLLSATLVAQTAPADTTFHTVTYIETAPSSAREATGAFRNYLREARRLRGLTGIDVFEQIGRPGHWVIVEAWRDQKAFDARDVTVLHGPLEVIETIRITGFDQRPYKAVAVARPLTPGSGAISVIAHVDVAPNPAVAPMLSNLAVESRKERGNLRFDVLQHTMRGNHFTVIETWTDQKALDAHVVAVHTKKYRDDVLPLTGSPLDERVFKT